MATHRTVSWTIIRYIVSEILFSFLVSFLFFFFVFFINQLLLLAQEILTKKVPFHQVALLIVYAIPSIISLSTPFASLVGVLMTIGRLSSDNEVLVLLSSGLSYKNIFAPAIGVGLLVSLVSFFTNDVLLPAGTIQFNRLYRQILVSTPALELAAHSVKRYRNTVIITGGVTGNGINDIFIMDRTGDGERRLIMAKSARLRDAGKEGLSLDLTNAFIQSSKEVARLDYDYASSAFLRYWIPQEDMLQAAQSIGPREMSSVDVKKAIVEQEEALQIKVDERSNSAIRQALVLEDGLRNGPADAAWNRRKDALSEFEKETEVARDLKKDRTLLLYQLEYYRKFSMPFGAFAFVFLAVPLGLLAKRSGQTVGFIIGILISVLYWILLFGGQTLSMRVGYSPFWCMWFCNILTMGVGLVMCSVRIRK